MSLHNDSQITAPPSFEALYRDTRGRLTISAARFLQRYELCEDTAQALVEPSQQRLHGLGLSEDIVLARTRQALAPAGAADDAEATGGAAEDNEPGDDDAFTAAEAHWIATRLAELLGWEWEEAMPAPADRTTRASRLA